MSADPKMILAPYLSFNGDCEAAFQAYARIFGGTLGEMFRYGGSPMAGDVPDGWAEKIMHGSVVIAGVTVMGADMAQDKFDPPKGFSMSVHLKDVAEAERIFGALVEGGQILMPLEKTFWAERFGYAVDRFGITWSINCDAA